MSVAPVDPELVVTPAGPEHAGALVALFERAGTPCHCRYWHFTGDTNAWLARSAHEPDVSRREMTDALAARSDEALGLVALAGERAVGWLKLAKAPVLAKLYGQRIYRSLPCFQEDRDGVYAIACVLVSPEHRGHGVARALVHGAVHHARTLGARAVEAFPRRGDSLRADEVPTGPFPAFVAEGFTVVHDFAPYPVLRLVL